MYVNVQFLSCFCPVLYILINILKTLTQSFYIALSHINIRTRNKISAGVPNIRARINYPRGRGCRKKFLNFFEKIWQKLSHSAENTLFHILIHALHTSIHWLHILIHALTILIHWLGFRVSTPYLNTCYLWLGSRLHALPILIHALGSIS